MQISIVEPQNTPLHNMLPRGAYCVPCIHNMLPWSILCTLHTQYATRGAYCVGSVQMLFQWSSEGTQYAFLENMSRVLGYVCLLSNCPFVHPSVYLANLLSKVVPASQLYYIEVLHPHQQYFGDVVSNFGFLPNMKSTYGNHGTM